MICFRKKLKTALAELNLQQKDLVTLSGLSAYTVSRYVNGHTEPPPEKIELIRKSLGLPVGYFGEEETPVIESKKHGAIHRITLMEMIDRYGLDAQTWKDAAVEMQLPGFYVINPDKSSIYVINEEVFCKV